LYMPAAVVVATYERWQLNRVMSGQTRFISPASPADEVTSWACRRVGELRSCAPWMGLSRSKRGLSPIMRIEEIIR